MFTLPRTLIKPRFVDKSSIKEQYNKLFQENLKNFKDEKITQVLRDTWKFHYAKDDNISMQRLFQLDDFIRKSQLCNESLIKREINACILSTDKVMSDSFLDYTENLLDAYNAANDQYYPIYRTNIIPNNTFLNKMADKVMFYINSLFRFYTFRSIATTKQEQFYSEPYLNSLVCKRNFRKVPKDSEEFQNSARFSYFENFLSRFRVNESFKDELYNIIYLSKQSPERQKYFSDFNNKYSTKILYYPSKSPKQIDIYSFEKEFDTFKKLFKDKNKMPSFLKVTSWDSYFTRYKECQAYYKSIIDEIILPNLKYHKAIFRHEMVHHFDKSSEKTWNRLRGEHLTLNQMIELYKAGVDLDSIIYANTALDEAKAVFGQGNMQKYSKKIKKYMISKGFPKEFLKLKDISYMDYLVNDLKLDKTLCVEIRRIYGGIIPYDLVDGIKEYDTKGLPFAIKYLKDNKNKKNLKPKDFCVASAMIKKLASDLKDIPSEQWPKTKTIFGFRRVASYNKLIYDLADILGVQNFLKGLSLPFIEFVDVEKNTDLLKNYIKAL